MAAPFGRDDNIAPIVISECILEGQKVRLRPVRPGDLEPFVDWLQDAEVRRWLAALHEPPTLEEEVEWYEETRANPDNVLWAIETLDGQLLGTCELRAVPRHRRAELGISIHDRREWGKGYGEDAVRLMLEYGFGDMELERVELTTDEDNARGRRCYEKCGFVEEGLMRRHRVIDGEPGNTIVMSILREEWTRK
jgi:RimJ/RimL family protein N-acetyltransferase